MHRGMGDHLGHAKLQGGSASMLRPVRADCTPQSREMRARTSTRPLFSSHTTAMVHQESVGVAGQHPHPRCVALLHHTAATLRSPPRQTCPLLQRDSAQS